MSSDSLNLAQNLAYTALQKPPSAVTPNVSHPATVSQAPHSPTQPQKKQKPFPILPVLAGAVIALGSGFLLWRSRGKNVTKDVPKKRGDLSQVADLTQHNTTQHNTTQPQPQPQPAPTTPPPAPPAPATPSVVGVNKPLDICTELQNFVKKYQLPLTSIEPENTSRYQNTEDSLYARARNQLTPSLLGQYKPYLLGSYLENRRYDPKVLEDCRISFRTYVDGKGYVGEYTAYPKNYAKNYEFPNGNYVSYIGQVVKMKYKLPEQDPIKVIIQNGRFVSYDQHLLDHGTAIPLSLNIHSHKNELSLLQKKLAVIACLTPPDMVALKNGLGQNKITAPFHLFYDLIGGEGISAKIDTNGFPHAAIEVIERLYEVCIQKENVQMLLKRAGDNDPFAQVIKKNIAGLLRMDKEYGLLEPLDPLPYTT